jgi:large subunit ribosomal protein L31
MKSGIHPTYNDTITVTCACGNTFVTGSTVDSLTVEICSNCHPFWTGDHKFVDIEGRVDKFKKKVDIAEKARKERVEALKAKMAKQKEAVEGPKSLKDMLKALQ